ncbi:hypothetical protein EON77_16070, partial [bacterium]
MGLRPTAAIGRSRSTRRLAPPVHEVDLDERSAGPLEQVDGLRAVVRRVDDALPDLVAQRRLEDRARAVAVGLHHREPRLVERREERLALGPHGVGDRADLRDRRRRRERTPARLDDALPPREPRFLADDDVHERLPQRPATDLKRAVLRLDRKWRADQVVIEDAGTGIALWQEFRASGELRPRMWTVSRDKESRVVGVSAQLEAGLCKLPTEAPWLDDFHRELRAFPHGRHDDQVDSMSQFLEYHLRHA